MTDWCPEADATLIDYLNSTAGVTATTAAPIYQFALSKQVLSYCDASLAARSLLYIQVRILAVLQFNEHLECLLPLIDLSNDDPLSLGAMVRRFNRYLLLKIKKPLLEKALSATAAKSGKHNGSEVPATLTLDNAKTTISCEKGHRDPSTSQNCFVQAFHQLKGKDSAVYRHIFSRDRCFNITFHNESGIDAGGVFREGIARMVDDLFSEDFDLLLLCPNAQQQVHINTEKYLPNPKHAHSGLALDMFEFIGKLMGMSLRAKCSLPFEFPLFIWKKLVGETVQSGDLDSIDIITSRLVDSVRYCDQDVDDPITSEAAFAEKFGETLRFDYIYGETGAGAGAGAGTGTAGSSSMATNRAVTFANRIEFCDALVAARLTAHDNAVAAMRRGLVEAVPARALWLFSATQLEELVCGSAEFDLEVWKAHTDAEGVPKHTVDLFWRVMASLGPKEHAGFVRFAWGRSRLPPAKEFTVRMKLISGGSAALPQSHTCFFSIEMPHYKTEEEMRHGLMVCIHYGGAGVLNS